MSPSLPISWVVCVKNMLDPLTALGLAGNIIQIVHFATELRDNTNGLLVQLKNSRTLICAAGTELHPFEDPADQPQSCGSHVSADAIHGGNTDFCLPVLQILDQCEQVGLEILKLTNKFSHSDAPTRLQALRDVLRSINMLRGSTSYRVRSLFMSCSP